MSKAKQKPPIQVRPDDDLEAYLRQMAEKSCRSVNKEVLYRLQQSRIHDQRQVAQKGNQQ